MNWALKTTANFNVNPIVKSYPVYISLFVGYTFINLADTENVQKREQE